MPTPTSAQMTMACSWERVMKPPPTGFAWSCRAAW
jgi:hypothetical protein